MLFLSVCAAHYSNSSLWAMGPMCDSSGNRCGLRKSKEITPINSIKCVKVDIIHIIDHTFPYMPSMYSIFQVWLRITVHTHTNGARTDT